MPAFLYDESEYRRALGTVNLATDTLKWMLVTQAYVPARGNTSVTALAAAEITATGYARGFGGAGRLSAPRTITKDTLNHIIRVVFSANATWSPLGGAINDIVAAVALIKEVTTDADSIPVAYFPLGATLAGDRTLGGIAVTALAGTGWLTIGMPVTGDGIPDGTTVATITSNTAITLSAPATAAVGTPLEFGPPIPTNGSDFNLARDASTGNLTFTMLY